MHVLVAAASAWACSPSAGVPVRGPAKVDVDINPAGPAPEKPTTRTDREASAFTVPAEITFRFEGGYRPAIGLPVPPAEWAGLESPTWSSTAAYALSKHRLLAVQVGNAKHCTRYLEHPPTLTEEHTHTRIEKRTVASFEAQYAEGSLTSYDPSDGAPTVQGVVMYTICTPAGPVVASVSTSESTQPRESERELASEVVASFHYEPERTIPAPPPWHLTEAPNGNFVSVTMVPWVTEHTKFGDAFKAEHDRGGLLAMCMEDAPEDPFAAATAWRGYLYGLTEDMEAVLSEQHVLRGDNQGVELLAAASSPAPTLMRIRVLRRGRRFCTFLAGTPTTDRDPAQLDWARPFLESATVL